LSSNDGSFTYVSYMPRPFLPLLEFSQELCLYIRHWEKGTLPENR